MNIDTGVDFAHPALNYRWRGNHAPASQAWFDPEGGSTSPNDCNNHGTHTMGIMTGLDPSTRDTIGVAFGAQWIAAKTICSTPHTSNSIAALQWAMDPDGNPSTIDDMPVAIGNSWWDPDIGDSTQCDPAQNPYIDVISAVEAAGIAVVFSAGNSGPASSTITRPKNVNTDEVNFWATGAIDGNNPSFPVALFSSRGPVISECQTGIPSLDIKPEASAPGVSVRSSVIGGGYSYLSGTSMACPHVVGALALLREAHPGKTGRELKMALYRTALDLGDPGEDNDYGMGLIDVYAAHLALIDSLDPEPPGNFTAYSDYSSPTSIILSWDDPSRFLDGDTLLISDFRIMIERDGVLFDSVNGGVEQFPDSGLINGQYYNYSIFTKIIATDSSSEKADTAWTAGGALQPGAPLNFTATQSGTDLTMRWENPSTNIDGTPLIDFAGIHLYENNLLVATYNRSVSDSGQSDSALYSPPAGVFTYYVSAFDNDSPANESGPSNPAFSPLSIPFFDVFETPPVPVADFWMNDNGEVTDQSVNPPSPQYALMLDGHPDGGDEVTLLPVDLSAFAGQGLILSYFYQPEGGGNAPETGDSLILEFLNDQGQWKMVKAYPGSNVIPFRNELIELDSINPGTGASFFHPAFQLRFRNYGSANSTSHFDLWFVDDLFLGLPATNPRMAVAPASIYDSVMVGETRIKNLEIMNHQSFPGDLIFSILKDPGMSWLNVSPASGTIPSNQKQIVNVNIDAAGLNPGLYSTSLIVSGNDTTNLQDTVAVSLRVVEAPAMGISPDSLYFIIRPGTNDSTILNLNNSGDALLHILAI
ncbi:MAG: S8 family serine peptidase, partial [Calditrichia bacterium]